MATRVSRRTLAAYYADRLTTGTAAATVATQLAAYLIDTRRTKELEVLVRDIGYQLSLRGVVGAVVTSAQELQSEAIAQITDYIATQTGAKDVQIDTVIDTSVLGGVKIDIPGQQLDSTLAHRLTNLKALYKK